MDPKSLFNKMHLFYGDQNWWPGEGFEIAIGAILTQNTSWKNVEKALKNLSKASLLNPHAILQSKNDFLKEQIKPSGYFNQKSIYLKNLSKLWIENPNPSRKELLAVKGIGAETADSILLYLLNTPEFIIDTYTIRIIERIGIGSFQSKSKWKEYFEKKIEKKISIFNEFHALLVIHAKTYCRKTNPLCSSCFLREDCQFGKKNLDSI